MPLIANPIPLPKEIDNLIYQIERMGTLPADIYFRNESAKKRNEKERKRQAENKAKMAEILKEGRQKQAQKRALRQAYTPKKTPRNRIKITSADQAFSLCVRLRANCICERCNKAFAPNNMKWLHCSHNYSRGMTNIRHHPDNAFALCKDCHHWFSRYTRESTPWFEERLGEKRLTRLRDAIVNAPVPTTQDEAKISAYFSILARQMKRERAKGNTDYLNFPPFDFTAPHRLLQQSLKASQGA